jgi:transmembrane sensor
MNKKSKNNQSISKETEQIIRNYQLFVNSNKEEVLDTLLKRIESAEKPVRKITPAVPWNRVAGFSVAATVAVLVAFWFFTASITFSTDRDETSTHRLPDASRVILHHGSSITFNKYYLKRRVKLIGEAYFEVEKGKGFRVKTSRGEVEVLGTRFLVNERGKQFKVQCFQGSVKTNYQKQYWILEPGTEFIGQDSDAQKNSIEKETGYPEFAKFKKNYSNAPLSLVVNDIEDFFEVEIELTIPPGRHFSGTIHSGNLNNTLQIVCKPLGLNYRTDDPFSVTIF